MKLNVRIVVLLVISVCLNSFGQSTLTSFKTGSLIIPMDNSKQNLISSQVAFNVKAYGLVNALLQNHIPVHWIIKDAKVKDAVDFSVLAGRISPSATAAALTDFRSGPFVIDSLWASTAIPIITAYGNNVSVYRAQAAFTAPVRYQLMFKPKIAVFTNGNSQLIHTKALRLAGFSSPAHFDSLPAQNMDAASCYTFGCEPHWSGGQNSVTTKVTNFLNSGGNFFAQCVGIDAYEQFEHHHTTNGIVYETSSFNQDNNNIYSGTDQPWMQFEGALTNAPTGALVNYKNNGGTYQPLTQFLVKKSPAPAAGVADGDVVLSTRKTGFEPIGGNATYLGGHDYLKGTFDLLDLGLLGLDYARASDVTWNNGLRIFYNAIFVPSTRPTTCEFVFAGEAKVSLGINNTAPCLNDTVEYTISFTNAGPGTAHNILVKTASLPTGLTYVSNTSSQGTYSAGTNNWTIGQLEPNTTVQLTIRYKVTADGTYTLKAYNANLIAGNAFTEDTSSLVFTTNQNNPVLLAPAAVNTSTNSGCTAIGVNLGTPTVTDDCGIASLTNNAPSTYPLGTTTVTWTVVDNSGNTVTATQLVTISDTENPTITAPAGISVSPITNCDTTLSLGTPTTSDNCGVASVTNNAPAVFSPGTTTVIWTVTDNAGNTATANQSVTVADNQNPTITAPANISVFPVVNCDTTINLGTPITSDNCGVASVTNNAPASFPLGTTTVVWTVTDNSGNTATANQTVTVTDNQNPTLAAPANITTSTNSACSAAGINLGTPITNDNCTVSSVTNNAPASFPLGATTVTWTVTDNSGNTASANQTVTITDNENPVITAPAAISVFPVSSCDTVISNLGTPTTSDNCGVASVTNNAPAVFPSGVTTVVWTVADNAGNTVTANQTVTVTDSQNPAITAPANISVFPITNCDTTVSLGIPVTTDNCVVASVTNNAPAVFPSGITTVVWTVTDNSGNTATANQTVTVTDNQNPALTAPANITTSTNSACSAAGINLGTPITSDNCGVASVTNNAPAVFSPGTTTVIWTATDNSGNTTTANQTVTITDDENPMITAPAAVSVFPVTTCDTVISDLGTPTVTDNCGVASVTNNAPASFPLGSTTVIWTVTDNSGNTATANQTVTVTDNQDPTITAPANVNTSTNSGCTAIGVNLGTPTTFDNCGVASVTNDAPASFPLGNTTITWTVTDNSGNSSVATQTVSVVDSEVPVISNCNDTIKSCESIVNFQLPTAVDNCTLAVLSQTDGTTLTSGSSFPEGYTLLHYEAIDVSGNQVVCTKAIYKITLPNAPEAGENQTIYADETVLNAVPDAEGTGEWNVIEGSGHVADQVNPNSVISGLQKGNTILTWKMSNEGCESGTDTVVITYVDLNIPNAFSPDGDNRNDFFEIKGIESYGPAQMIISNRWGEIVYESTNYVNDWNGQNKNGQELTNDTYYYQLILNDKSEFSGFVIVKRK